MSPAQPGLLMFASIPASILGGKSWTDCTRPVAYCRSGSGLGRARLPSTSCACISQGNQGSFQGQAALLGQVRRLKVRDVQSVASETKHHTQPACREQSQDCAGSQTVQKSHLEGWARDWQLCNTGGDHVLGTLPAWPLSKCQGLAPA